MLRGSYLCYCSTEVVHNIYLLKPGFTWPERGDKKAWWTGLLPRTPCFEEALIDACVGLCACVYAYLATAHCQWILPMHLEAALCCCRFLPCFSAAEKKNPKGKAELFLCSGPAQLHPSQGRDLQRMSEAWLKLRLHMQAVCELLPFLSGLRWVPVIVLLPVFVCLSLSLASFALRASR